MVIGAGQAALQAIDTLRRRGYDGSITLIGEETLEPYQRPPLSKGYLAAAIETERLQLRPAQYYRDNLVDMRLGTRAVAIDPGACRIRLADGGELCYQTLLIATGSRPRRLQVPGADLEGVYFLRTASDARRIRDALRPSRRLVVIGGGYIGLEVAATCCDLGLDVTVLETADRVLARVCAPPVSAFYESEHRRRGVNVVCGAGVHALLPATGSRSVGAVVSERGTFPADLVLVGVGAAPADELAAAAGLECSSGILVDERCRTGHPRIRAAGDCTVVWSPRYGRRIHLESVDNAFEQGVSAALDMLGTLPAQEKAPWFWSDQFDLKLVIVGLSAGCDRVVLRGTPESRSFSVCHLKAGELLAIETVNRAKDQIAARKLIAARVRCDAERLADPSIPLAECARGPIAQSAK